MLGLQKDRLSANREPQDSLLLKHSNDIFFLGIVEGSPILEHTDVLQDLSIITPGGHRECYLGLLRADNFCHLAATRGSSVDECIMGV